MADADPPPAGTAALRAVLGPVAARGGTLTYGALAAALGLPGPGRIQRLAALLEAAMAEDAAAGRPLLAAAAAQRLGSGLPAPGFFAAAAALGRYAGPPAGPEAAAFVARERAALARTEGPEGPGAPALDGPRPEQHVPGGARKPGDGGRQQP